MSDHYWRVYVTGDYPIRNEFFEDGNNRTYMNVEADDIVVHINGAVEFIIDGHTELLLAPGSYIEIRRAKITQKEIETNGY